jgi:hypothetical protein
VEPVNESLRTRGSCSSAADDGAGFAGRHDVDDPGGQSGLLEQRADRQAVSGVSLAGLSTIEQPAARAGPILRVAIAAGKFHGVTSTHTPIG